MPVVSDGGWLSVNERRKAVRDAVRKRFQASVQVKPSKTMQDLTVAPEAQIPVIAALISTTSAAGSNDIRNTLAVFSTMFAELGFGLGPMGGNASTGIDLDKLVPQGLMDGHFLDAPWLGVSR